MEVYKKIRFIRQLKNWSQEDMAEKLQMSVKGYANIEQGHTDVKLSRLEQIADTFDINLLDLLGLNENNIFNINEFQNNSSGQFTTFGNVFAEEKETHLKFELQRLNLIVEQQIKEIDYLKQQVTDLREMNQLLKNNEG